MYSVAIVGAGAAGLALSVMIKRNNPELSVVLIERLDRVGKKISVTGNGRCNISNISICRDNYHSHSDFNAMSVINQFNFEKTKEFFSSIGVEFRSEGNKCFPYSLQAASVVDALRFAAEESGTEFMLSQSVKSVKSLKKTGGFILSGDNLNIKAKTVVFACGGLAGGNKLGCDNSGFKLIEKLGHQITKLSPAIVQIKTENTLTRQLKGVKVNAAVSVLKNGSVVAKDSGEVLFCDYGLSGPPVLQLSGYCNCDCEIVLDIMPEFSENEISDLIKKRIEVFKNKPMSEFFAGLIHKRLGQIILKYCKISLNDFPSCLGPHNISEITKTIKHLAFRVTGNTGFANAQSTFGGAYINEFYEDTMMSKKVGGLFAIGEILDVCGDCGGYNLQWAWSSAYVCSKGICKYLGENK